MLLCTEREAVKTRNTIPIMITDLHIFPTIDHIASKYQALLLDAYGVFWGGNDVGLLPGSKEIMEKYVSEGKIIGILSNTTQPADKEINKLQLHGLHQGQHFHFLITSGEIVRHIFSKEKLPFIAPRKTFLLFGGAHPKFPHTEAFFKDTAFREVSTVSEADFIYASIPHIKGEDQTDPEKFRDEIKNLIHQKLPMVCPNPDQFAHEGKPPRAVVRQGGIARLYEEMGGEVYYIGKPETIAYTFALEKFQQYNINNPSEILMVGDTPETDIRGARKFGMPSVLIIKTGIMADRISRLGQTKALESIPQSDLPNYLIERFAHAIHPAP